MKTTTIMIRVTIIMMMLVCKNITLMILRSKLVSMRLATILIMMTNMMMMSKKTMIIVTSMYIMFAHMMVKLYLLPQRHPLKTAASFCCLDIAQLSLLFDGQQQAVGICCNSILVFPFRFIYILQEVIIFEGHFIQIFVLITDWRNFFKWLCHASFK